MKSSKRVLLAALFAVAVCVTLLSTAHAGFVTIGNPGNVPDTLIIWDGTSGYGAVPYTYQISRTAVSIAEWALFYGDGTTGFNGVGGGTAVGYFNPTYNYWNDGTRTVGRNAPAVRISFFQAAQYCNWRTTGDAVQGAYTIDTDPQSATYGYVIDIMSRADILASGNLYYLIPTEDEWYKAAYFKPDGSGYTFYAHGADTVPPQSTDGSTGWNYYDNGNALAPPNLVWAVDSGTQEQNGTFNMMGNVREWNEGAKGSDRVLRGGAYVNNASANLNAGARYSYTPTHGYLTFGLRVVSVPEPASSTMLLMGAVGLLLWRRRRNG